MKKKENVLRARLCLGYLMDATYYKTRSSPFPQPDFFCIYMFPISLAVEPFFSASLPSALRSLSLPPRQLTCRWLSRSFARARFFQKALAQRPFLLFKRPNPPHLAAAALRPT